MLKKLFNIIELLKQAFYFNFIISKEENEFRNFLKTQNSLSKSNTNENILLVPLINDLGTMKIIIKIAAYITTTENLKVKYFFVHTPIDKKKQQKINVSGAINKLSNWSYISMHKLMKIYAINQHDIIISNYTQFSKANSEDIEWFKSKSDVLLLKHREVEIGELLYDTYLRFRSKPTIDLQDDELYVIHSYILGLTEKWDDFFNENKISKILLPYLSYHHWGIPGKMALKHDVGVLTFGSYLYLLQKGDVMFPYHTKNFNLYPVLFRSVNDKNACLEIAQNKLEDRFTGVIDKGISYMKKSSFNSINEVAFLFVENRKWVVVFLHCFFDSPHIYGNGLFVDFYEWLTFLLDEASKNISITYYIKRHPNGLPENEAIVCEFITKYAEFENIVFLPVEINNTSIIKGGPSLIVTYYGTVAHEFAYCGIPAVTCGENPHSQYNFVYHAKSISELSWFMANAGEFGLPDKYIKEDILEFFYMHYVYFSKKYNQLNFDLEKNIEAGTINVPDNESIENMLYNVNDTI